MMACGTLVDPAIGDLNLITVPTEGPNVWDLTDDSFEVLSWLFHALESSYLTPWYRVYP